MYLEKSYENIVIKTAKYLNDEIGGSKKIWQEFCQTKAFVKKLGYNPPSKAKSRPARENFKQQALWYMFITKDVIENLPAEFLIEYQQKEFIAAVYDDQMIENTKYKNSTAFVGYNI